jgi:uncharacterized protein YutE (UPF0331/DUF86 family)
MNEQRIREIANQASDHAENTVEYFPDTEDGLDYPAKMMKVRDLKFAQLIVRECIDICHKMAEDSDSYVVHDGDTCAKQIREHFGVEE